jgi:hypothetical protein
LDYAVCEVVRRSTTRLYCYCTPMNKNDLSGLDVIESDPVVPFKPLRNEQEEARIRAEQEAEAEAERLRQEQEEQARFAEQQRLRQIAYEERQRAREEQTRRAQELENRRIARIQAEQAAKLEAQRLEALHLKQQEIEKRNWLILTKDTWNADYNNWFQNSYTFKMEFSGYQCYQVLDVDEEDVLCGQSTRLLR